MFPVTSGFVGGVSMIGLAFATHATAPVVLSVLSLAAYSVLHTTTGIILMENYPTSVRCVFNFVIFRFLFVLHFFIVA